MESPELIRKLLLSVLFVSSAVYSQQYPPVIWVPVTYYDFHSDRSNPEFEQRHQGGPRTGMVANQLGPDGKPQLGPTPYLNYGIANWFKPWTPGNSTYPSYEPRAAAGQVFRGGDNWKLEYQQEVIYRGSATADHDTSFKNLVIHDSLPFTHIGNGQYEYRNDAFFPLDKRGFGNEWNHEKGNPDQHNDVDHNYSFTMELHCNFVKQPGLTFTFRGDDDVWVFVNNTLQMDLGGIHEAIDGHIDLDNIPGLVNGSAYTLDVFYAERHSAESHIWITTNIISAPSNLRLYKQPGTPDAGSNKPIGSYDSVSIGQPYTLYGHVFDSTGTWRPEYDDQITWEITSGGILNTDKGVSTIFTPTRPGTYILTARFKDPDNPSRESISTVTLYVKAGSYPPPFTLKLYSQPGDPSSLVPLSGTDEVKAGNIYTVYGHLFDTAGTWMSGYDQYIKWRVVEINSGVVPSPDAGVSTSIRPTIAGVITLQASFADPTDLSRPPSEARLSITVKAGDEHHLDIQPDSVITSYNSDDDFDELIFGNNENRVRVFAVVRDEFGNFIRYAAPNTSWRSDNNLVADVTSYHGSSTFVVKQQTGIGEETILIAYEQGLIPDTITVGSLGNSATVAWPNPFTPGVSKLPGLGTGNSKVYEFYQNVLQPFADKPFGILIGIETPRPLKPVNPGEASNPQASYAHVNVYDAVGNLVATSRSGRKDLRVVRAQTSRTFGIVWNGTNDKGRTVGGGTYLFDIKGKQTDGRPFFKTMKVAVTREAK